MTDALIPPADEQAFDFEADGGAPSERAAEEFGLPRFTHVLRVRPPASLADDYAQVLDRYTINQLVIRWHRPFLRLEPGAYALDLDADAGRDAAQTQLWLSVALFGKLSAEAVRIDPLGASTPPAPEALEPSAEARFRRTLARFEQATAPAAQSGPATDLSDVLTTMATASRETAEAAAGLRADLAAADLPGLTARLAEPTPSAPTGPAPESLPTFDAAKTSASTFSTAVRALTRRVDGAVADLEDAAARVSAAAPAHDAAAQPETGSSNDAVMASLAESLAELARGQAAITARLDAGLDASLDASPAQTSEQDTVATGLASVEERLAALEAAVLSETAALRSALDAPEADGGAAAPLYVRMTETATGTRQALEEMLDVAVAWRRSLDSDEAALAATEFDAVDDEDADPFAQAMDAGDGGARARDVA